MASDLRNGIVGIVLKKAEELADLNEELRRSNRELEAFSYSVSHDLRAPFRHILGYSELLQEESKGMSDKARRYIATIIESANYAGTLVDNLLSLSRVARTKLNYVPIDMNLLVEEVRQDALAEARGRNILWRVADLPVVNADLVTLRLALHNLLSNALKFTRCRIDAIIEIGCETGRDADVFFVRDNGIGFDMAYVDKLFGVFQRLHRMEDFEGTGIGLANVRRIIERHRGRTWAEGEEQKGATFYFSLPKTQMLER
jgi:light-regulated signal transduction histidine kinase (bacteriophytochrome)